MLSLVIVGLALIVATQASNCVFTIDGRTYDLRSLVASNGSYTFNQELEIDGVNGTYTWELQLCQPVKSAYRACSSAAPNSVMNRIDKSGNCLSLGDSTVEAADLTPYEGGVMLQYYHGSWVNHISSIHVYYYIECGSTTMSQPIVEHFRSCVDTDNEDDPTVVIGNQYHVTFNSKLVC